MGISGLRSLVCEHREELVLSPIGLGQRFQRSLQAALGSLVLGHVGADPEEANRSTFRITVQLRVRFEPADCRRAG